MERSHRGHVLCISGRQFGFEGKTGSGAWVMKVVEATPILEDTLSVA